MTEGRTHKPKVFAEVAKPQADWAAHKSGHSS
jgi:hypothetical protein